MLRASFALKDSQSSIIHYWLHWGWTTASMYIYILMITITVYIICKTIDRWERRMTGHVIYVQRIELVTRTIWTFGNSHRFCDIDFKEVVLCSLIIRSDSCEWRCGRISHWAGFREKRRWSDEHLSRRRWTKIVAELVTCIASKWQSVNQWKRTRATSSEDSGSTEQIASSWDEHC